MNIFYLHTNPEIAARMQCDKHVVKMILESAQLLSTAHWILNPENAPDGIYKATHVNHPSSIWTRSSKLHYQWLYAHFEALCEEYAYRYDREHMTARLKPLLSDSPKALRRIMTFDPPPQCMPEQYKSSRSTVNAYRAYYRSEKAGIAKWTLRKPPHWWPESE